MQKPLGFFPTPNPNGNILCVFHDVGLMATVPLDFDCVSERIRAQRLILSFVISYKEPRVFRTITQIGIVYWELECFFGSA